MHADDWPVNLAGSMIFYIFTCLFPTFISLQSLNIISLNEGRKVCMFEFWVKEEEECESESCRIGTIEENPCRPLLIQYWSIWATGYLLIPTNPMALKGSFLFLLFLKKCTSFRNKHVCSEVFTFSPYSIIISEVRARRFISVFHIQIL